MNLANDYDPSLELCCMLPPNGKPVEAKCLREDLRLEKHVDLYDLIAITNGRFGVRIFTENAGRYDKRRFGRVVVCDPACREKLESRALEYWDRVYGEN